MLSGYLLISKWVPAAVSTVLLFCFFLTAAVIGRVSGTITARCSFILGRAMFSPLVRKPAAMIFGGDIQSAEVRETAGGFTEVSYVDFGYDEVLEELSNRGLAPEVFQVNLASWQAYVALAEYEKYHPDYYLGEPTYLVHKQVQHYLSTALTPIKRSEVWMDVASSTSPFPEILARVYGVTVYRQDLSYPQGIHGLRIGGDASSIPLPESSIDRVSLHCAFEHFEGRADTGFMKELARILKPGGTACIIPLYVSDTYQIMTNPRYWLLRGIPKEKRAQTTISRTYWESFGRFYDADALRERIIQPLNAAGLDARLIKAELPREIDYPSFVVLHITKPCAPTFADVASSDSRVSIPLTT